jgi:hypothetical protein
MDGIKSTNIFSNSTGHALPSEKYNYFFLYLRQSPSYKLALSVLDPFEEPIPSKVWYPQDFNSVRATAHAAGDVHTTNFEEWWMNRGLLMFGERGPKPIPRIVHEAGREAHRPWHGLEASIEPLYKSNWRTDGMTFYVEIPEETTRSEMMALLDQIQTRVKKLPSLHSSAKFKLLVSKINRHTLDLGHQALELYQTTDMELWRIGAKIGMSNKYKEQLDYTSPKVRGDESDEKRSMTAMVVRLLKKAKNLSENAARGIFPSVDEPPYPAVFHRLIKDKNLDAER